MIRAHWTAMRTPTLALALSLLAVGCSFLGGGGEIPDGFTAIERDVFTAAYPPGWNITADEPAQVAATGPDSVGNVFEGMLVQVDDEFFGDFDAAVQALIEPFRLLQAEGWEEIDDRELDVPGAVRSRLIDATYDSEIFDGRMRQQSIMAIPEEGGPLVFLQIRTPADIFDEALAAQIVDSLSL